jgi:hypothetical protein
VTSGAAVAATVVAMGRVSMTGATVVVAASVSGARVVGGAMGFPNSST